MAASSKSSIAPTPGAAYSLAALSAHDALPRLRSAQEAVAELASLQEAAAQLAADQDAAAQLASLHEAAAHEASAWALAAQLAASKTGAPVKRLVTTNVFRALFGFGGLSVSIEGPAATSPTPTEREDACGSGSAPTISAPLTWSAVYSGCLPRISAAIPLTIGAENEVPESIM